MFMDELNRTVTPFNAFLTNELSKGTPYLLPDIDVTRSFTTPEDAVTYMQGREFQRRFNPNKETHLGIRADFQGFDRDARPVQSVLDEEAARRIKILKETTPVTTEAERLALQQQINQIQNRAWYTKRFYTDLNTPTGAKDVNWYLKKALQQEGALVDSSRLTVLAGSNPAEMIPLAGQQAFGGTTTDFATGQGWMQGFKKQYNFPQLIASSTNVAPEARAASYLSTNPASELFPTPDAIARYGKHAGNVDVDNMAIELYGRAKNPLEYGIKPANLGTTAAARAGLLASLLVDAPELTARENKKRLKAYPEGYTGSREANAFEVGQMLAKGAGKSVLNALTMGMAYSGNGEDRPTRGMARMEDSSTEAYRRMTERAKNWIPE